MGHKLPNLTPAVDVIRMALATIHSPYNDGYVQMHCKHELYLLKCWLDEQYNSLPTFSGEEQWLEEQEKKQVIQILKR